jgi:hypothetical protein
MPVLVDLAFMDRTVRIRYRDQVGTALYVEIEGIKLLLTAGHIIQGMESGDRIGIRFQSDWHLVDVRDVEFCDAGTDVAVICPATQWGEGIGENQLSGEIILGEDVAYCGFPLSMETYGLPGALGWPKGFVKSGIFSGAMSRPDGSYEYLFDTINNRGFSGGPILVRHQGKLQVAGVVSRYKYDAPNPVYRKRSDDTEEVETEYYVKPNSGFMVGVPIKRAVDCGKRIVARFRS